MRRFGLDNARRHRLRIDPVFRRRESFEIECERRRNRLVSYNGVTINDRELFTHQECETWFMSGYQVPLDLVPRSYWWNSDGVFPRFGEESLGDQF